MSAHSIHENIESHMRKIKNIYDFDNLKESITKLLFLILLLKLNLYLVLETFRKKLDLTIYNHI